MLQDASSMQMMMAHNNTLDEQTSTLLFVNYTTNSISDYSLLLQRHCCKWQHGSIAQTALFTTLHLYNCTHSYICTAAGGVGQAPRARDKINIP